MGSVSRLRSGANSTKHYKFKIHIEIVRGYKVATYHSAGLPDVIFSNQ
jgi:hypothetical protein